MALASACIGEVYSGGSQPRACGHSVHQSDAGDLSGPRYEATPKRADMAPGVTFRDAGCSTRVGLLAPPGCTGSDGWQPHKVGRGLGEACALR